MSFLFEEFISKRLLKITVSSIRYYVKFLTTVFLKYANLIGEIIESSTQRM